MGAPRKIIERGQTCGINGVTCVIKTKRPQRGGTLRPSLVCRWGVIGTLGQSVRLRLVPAADCAVSRAGSHLRVQPSGRADSIGQHKARSLRGS